MSLINKHLCIAWIAGLVVGLVFGLYIQGLRQDQKTLGAVRMEMRAANKETVRRDAIAQKFEVSRHETERYFARLRTYPPAGDCQLDDVGYRLWVESNRGASAERASELSPKVRYDITETGESQATRSIEQPHDRR
jgi:hypothetical protein